MERPKKNPQRVRTRYSKEFKLEAVRLLKLGQKPPTELALRTTGVKPRFPADRQLWPSCVS